MLGKIIKYDMKAMNRFLIIIHAFLLIYAFFIRILITGRLTANNVHNLGNTYFLILGLTVSFGIILLTCVAFATSIIIAVHSFNKWCNRLHIPVNHSLHQFISHHKVSRRRILIDEKRCSASLHGLHHICRLGCTSTGILRGKCFRVFPIWQVIDEHRNVCVLDTSAVLSADFHCI